MSAMANVSVCDMISSSGSTFMFRRKAWIRHGTLSGWLPRLQYQSIRILFIFANDIDVPALALAAALSVLERPGNDLGVALLAGNETW